MALASDDLQFSSLLQDTANLSKPVQGGTNKNGDDVWIVCGGRAAIDSLPEEAAAEHADNEKSGIVKVFYVGNRKVPLPFWVSHLKRSDGESFTDHPGQPSVESIQQHAHYLEEIAAQITTQRGDNVRLVVVLCDQGLNRGPSAAAYALAKWTNIAGKDAAAALQRASNGRTTVTAARSRSGLPVVKPCCIMVGVNNWVAACNAYVPPASSVESASGEDVSDDEYEAHSEVLDENKKQRTDI